MENHRLRNKKVIGSKVVLCNKYKSNWSFNKREIRLVVLAFSQKFKMKNENFTTVSILFIHVDMSLEQKILYLITYIKENNKIGKQKKCWKVCKQIIKCKQILANLIF